MLKWSKLSLTFLFGIGFIVLFNGCVADTGSYRGKADDDVSVSEFVQKWRKQASEHRRKLPEMSERKLTPMAEQRAPSDLDRIESDLEKLPVKPVTLELIDTEVTAALRALARMGNQDMLIGENVAGQCSINFHEVPWRKAFVTIVEANALSYAVNDGIVRVLSVRDLEKTLQFEQMQARIDQTRAARRAAAPRFTRTVKINHLSIEEVEQMLTTLFGAGNATGEDGMQDGAISRTAEEGSDSRVSINKELNLVVIKGTTQEINDALALVEKIDRPSPQVLIEARIVVANQSAARELGMQWGGFFQSGLYAVTPGSNTGYDAETDSGFNETQPGWMSNFPARSLSSLAGDDDDGGSSTLPGQRVGNSGLTLGMQYYEMGDLLLRAHLSALESEGMLEVLSRPSITTLDNKTAFIESGSEIPFQTTSENEGTTTEFKKAVLRLEVTPHVVDGNFVKLKIFASNDEPDASFSNKDAEPAIFTRAAESNVFLSDGQTTVIAGLSREVSTESEAGVPILKDLPGVGRLFRSHSRESQLNELLIFITPHILNPVMVDHAEQSRNQDDSLSESTTQETGANTLPDGDTEEANETDEEYKKNEAGE